MSEPFVSLPGRVEPLLWRSEDPPPAPARVQPADDRTTAQDAVRRLRRGDFLLYGGNFKNARQLLAATGRRLAPRTHHGASTPLQLFRAERQSRQLEHATLSRLLVEVDAQAGLRLAAAPDIAEAWRWRWGPGGPSLIPLRMLLGILGAHEWYRQGLEVAGLRGRLRPHYGVFTPTRGEYPELLRAIADPRGKLLFDVGTGTGVLAFLLLERGAARAVGTDVDPAAVVCARENASALGFSDRFEAQERELFPEGRADVVVCNPPWLPEPIRSRTDRAVYDPDQRFLTGFLAGLASHLTPGGEGVLLLGNLAELLGLRPEGFLAETIRGAGLRVSWTRQLPARHPRSQDRADPLFALRSRELITAYGLVAAS